MRKLAVEKLLSRCYRQRAPIPANDKREEGTMLARARARGRGVTTCSEPRKKRVPVDRYSSRRTERADIPSGLVFSPNY